MCWNEKKSVNILSKIVLNLSNKTGKDRVGHWQWHFYIRWIFLQFEKEGHLNSATPLVHFNFESRWLMICESHSVKSVRIRSYSGPHFPAFGLNTERCGISKITSKTSITPNTDNFYTVSVFSMDFNRSLKIISDLLTFTGKLDNKL